MNPLFFRVLWHVNRSPLGKGIQAGLSLLSTRELDRRRRAAAGLALDAELREKADFLNKNGFVSLDGLMDPALQRSLLEDASAKVSRAGEISRKQTLTHKNFWVRLLDPEMRDGAMGTDSVYTRYALQTPVLSILSAAFGQVPILAYVLLTLSRDTGSAARIYSQN